MTTVTIGIVKMYTVHTIKHVAVNDTALNLSGSSFQQDILVWYSAIQVSNLSSKNMKAKPELDMYMPNIFLDFGNNFIEAKILLHNLFVGKTTGVADGELWLLTIHVSN